MILKEWAWLPTSLTKSGRRRRKINFDGEIFLFSHGGRWDLIGM